MGYQVTVERTDDGFVARNPRGAEIKFGTGGEEPVVTPVELPARGTRRLQRRHTVEAAQPRSAGHRLVRLAIEVTAEKSQDQPARGGDRDPYDIELPPGDDEALEVFRGVAHRVHERACTVSTALVTETPVELTLP